MNLRKLATNLALALGAPLLVFALAEGLLALAGVKPLALTEDPYVGYSALQPLFVDSIAGNGAAFKVTNPAKIKHFNAQSFPKVKAPGTFRIFCLGGSTTYGHPFHDPVSYSGWLRAFLAKADPKRHYEVINAGGISYASYREAALMEELSQYEPDLFVIYSGHNEFLEERTYRRMAALPPWLRTTSAWLDRTRSYSSLRRLLHGIGDHGNQAATSQNGQLASEVDDVLAKTIGPTSYVRDDSLKADVVAHFGYSLNRMGLLAEACGARILYVTTPVNEKNCSPFKSESTPGLSPDEAHTLAEQRRLAATWMAEGKNEIAFAALESAVSHDPRNAALRYQAGQAAYAAHLYPQAKVHFRAAIEEDICPLRALRVMDTAVRSAAASHGGHLLDFVDSLEKTAPGILGLPDFLDHVHLDLAGYRHLALGIVDQMVTMGALQPDPTFDSSALAQVTDSLNAFMTSAERGLALTNLAKVINWAGKHDEAAHLAEQALQLDTTSLEAIWSSLFVGALREREGRGLEALPHYRRAIRLDPNNPESRMHLGAALLRLDSVVEARNQLDTAYSLAPDDPDIRQQLELLTQRMRSGVQSEPVFASQQGLASAQSQALVAAGKVSAAQGRIPEALQFFARAAQLDPQNQAARSALSQLLQGGANGANGANNSNGANELKGSKP